MTNHEVMHYHDSNEDKVVRSFKIYLYFSRLNDDGTTDCYAEIVGDTLNLYGQSVLGELDKNWGIQAAGAVCTISFMFVEYDKIVDHLSKIRTRYPSVHVRHILLLV